MTRSAIPFLIAACLFACGRPKARIKSGDEGDLVGSSTAGSATYNRLIADATKKLLDAVAAKQTGGNVMKIAFIGIENRGAEDLGDIREATNQQIETVIWQAKRFDLIAQRYVTHGLQTLSLRSEDLMLKHGRDEFMRILREDGQVPAYLLWAVYTTLSTSGRKEWQRDYQLTLELIEAGTGRLTEKETTRVRKAYR